MKCIFRIATVFLRFAQRSKHFHEFDDRARPAMGHHQGQRIRITRADVQEMDIQTVDFGHELRNRVQPAFGLTPVVLIGPVSDYVFNVRKRHSLRPVFGRFGVRPAGRPQTPFQVVKLIVMDLDGEGADVAHG